MKRKTLSKGFERAYHNRAIDHISDKEEMEASANDKEEQINSDTQSYFVFPGL